MEGLIEGLPWGKPILASAADRPDNVLHNCHAGRIFDGAPRNLFVLHLSRLSTVQRIESNLNKLRSHGIIATTDRVEDVAGMEMSSSHSPTIERFVDEMLDLSKIGEYSNPEEEAKTYSIVFKGGRIEFDNSGQQKLLEQFISQDLDFLELCNPKNLRDLSVMKTATAAEEHSLQSRFQPVTSQERLIIRIQYFNLPIDPTCSVEHRTVRT